MKLHDVPVGAKFKFGDMILILVSIDGMFCNVRFENGMSAGKIVSSAEVELVEDV